MPNQPPYDLESEQALLGSIIQEPQLMKQIDLTIEDFYDPRCKKIYQCLSELFEDGTEISIISLNAKLKARKFSGEVPMKFLVELDNEIGSVARSQWKGYLSVIKKKSAARMLLALAGSINKFAQNGLNGLESKIDETAKQLAEIKAKAQGKRRNLTEEIREWILITSGSFLIADVYKDLGLIARDNKMKAAAALHRMEKENFIVKCGEKRGCYRLLEKDAPLIDFLNVNLSEPYPIKWPFQIEDLVDIYPGNVIVVAGAANAGKTALLLNVVRLNMSRFKIEYFSSEMGPEELHLRLRKFEDIALGDWRFSARQRSTKFADVIVPDSLNIIDYLEVTKDFYEIGGEIKDIFDRLGKGIAIIAIQKKSGSDYGRGGEFTMEKPRLYLSIENGTLKIVKGKNWSNPEINPNGLSWTFKLVQGCRFIETGGSAWNLS